MFDILKIRDRVWRIWDAGKNTFYLVEGEEKAAVIDTGITEGATITPMLRTLTDKPLILVVTHAHPDHFYHMDEFDTVYMSHKEFDLGPEILKFMMEGKDLDLVSTIPMATGSVIDLGGRALEIVDVPGHTPGSVAVYDKTDDLLFTGDAIGSGCGVWMQLPGSSSLAEYEQALKDLADFCAAKGGNMEFWGGHSNQCWESANIKPYNPLSMGLLWDLIELTRNLRLGKMEGQYWDFDPMLREREARFAVWGRAEMFYNPDKRF